MSRLQQTDNGAGYTNVVFVGDKEVKAEKVDDLTVKFTLPEVSASYYELLGKLILIPEHAFDGNTDIKSADANLTDIGSGPYKLVEFKDGESLTFESLRTIMVMSRRLTRLHSKLFQMQVHRKLHLRMARSISSQYLLMM